MTIAPRSPLELLHPDGLAQRACMLGRTLPDGLRPHARSGGPYDLVVAAPPARAPTLAWATAALALAADSLAPDGVVYLLPRRFEQRRVRRLVADHDLVIELELAHFPDLASSVFVVPLDRALVQFTLEELILPRGWRRRAIELLVHWQAALRLVSPVGFVVRRPGSRACFDWLAAPDATKRARAVVSRTRPASGPGFFVLHRFSDAELRPSGVAKIAPSDTFVVEREAAALGSVARTARAAGAAVPETITSTTLGGAGVLLLTPLRGQLAATLLARSPASFDAITGGVASWLGAWGRLTGTPLAATPDLLEETLVHPARLVAEHIRRGHAYLDRIERICAALEGRLVSGSSAHNDLTMWNLLIGAGGEIGVVDWEAATERTVPLVDFYYMVADAVAATTAYGDRALAFATAFIHEGRVSRRIAALERRLAAELRIDGFARELGFHACWLHHASNELQRSGRAGQGPFVRIVDAIAADEVPVRRRLDEFAGAA